MKIKYLLIFFSFLCLPMISQASLPEEVIEYVTIESPPLQLDIYKAEEKVTDKNGQNAIDQFIENVTTKFEWYFKTEEQRIELRTFVAESLKHLQEKETKRRQTVVESFRLEYPSFMEQRLSLESLPEEQKQSLYGFAEHYKQMYVSSYIPEPEKSRRISEFAKLVTQQEIELLSGDQWKNFLPNFSKKQKKVIQLYEETIFLDTRSLGSEGYLTKWNLQTLPVDGTWKDVQDYFKLHRVIKIRNLVNTPSPNLVIGCGLNAHPWHKGDDTVDPIISLYPTVIGFFSDHNTWIPKDHYSTVWDEGCMSYSSKTWEEMERILKPGGFLVLDLFNGRAVELPKKSRLHFVSFIQFENGKGVLHRRLPSQRLESGELETKTKDNWVAQATGYQDSDQFIALVKEDIKGTWPKEIQQDNMPVGFELKGQLLIK